MPEIAILKVFEGMPDERRKQGTRHSLQLGLALFTLSVAAGNQGFLAMGDWLNYHSEELKELFGVDRIPSYSAIRRILRLNRRSGLLAKSRAIFRHNSSCRRNPQFGWKNLEGFLPCRKRW